MQIEWLTCQATGQCLDRPLERGSTAAGTWNCTLVSGGWGIHTINSRLFPEQVEYIVNQGDRSTARVKLSEQFQYYRFAGVK